MCVQRAMDDPENSSLSSNDRCAHAIAIPPLDNRKNLVRHSGMLVALVKAKGTPLQALSMQN